MPNITVQPIHFEDFDGHQFERLVFTYLLRTNDWISLEWYGQSGSDSGRDIVGCKEDDHYPKGQWIYIQCANRKALRFAKIEKDIAKILKTLKKPPDKFMLISGGNVSAQLRDKINKHCNKKQFHSCEIWSGNEFEERLRAKTESLLKRFVEGEEFPDAIDEIRKYVQQTTPLSDDEIVALMASLFDRPAFYTPFNRESSIPAFKKAITDTIETLNTGIHRLGDGTEIRRIPSRHMIQSKKTRDALGQIERSLAELRSIFDEFLKTEEIKLCECGNPDCPVVMISSTAAHEMDVFRTQILHDFGKLYPEFNVRLGWRFRD